MLLPLGGTMLNESTPLAASYDAVSSGRGMSARVRVIRSTAPLQCTLQSAFYWYNSVSSKRTRGEQDERVARFRCAEPVAGRHIRCVRRRWHQLLQRQAARRVERPVARPGARRAARARDRRVDCEVEAHVAAAVERTQPLHRERLGARGDQWEVSGRVGHRLRAQLQRRARGADRVARAAAVAAELLLRLQEQSARARRDGGGGRLGGCPRVTSRRRPLDGGRRVSGDRAEQLDVALQVDADYGNGRADQWHDCTHNSNCESNESESTLKHNSESEVRGYRRGEEPSWSSRPTTASASWRSSRSWTRTSSCRSRTGRRARCPRALRRAIAVRSSRAAGTCSRSSCCSASRLCSRRSSSSTPSRWSASSRRAARSSRRRATSRRRAPLRARPCTPRTWPAAASSARRSRWAPSWEAASGWTLRLSSMSLSDWITSVTWASIISSFARVPVWR